jgi:hypothetical protein
LPGDALELARTAADVAHQSGQFAVEAEALANGILGETADHQEAVRAFAEWITSELSATERKSKKRSAVAR